MDVGLRRITPSCLSRASSFIGCGPLLRHEGELTLRRQEHPHNGEESPLHNCPFQGSSGFFFFCQPPSNKSQMHTLLSKAPLSLMKCKQGRSTGSRYRRNPGIRGSLYGEKPNSVTEKRSFADILSHGEACSCLAGLPF